MPERLRVGTLTACAAAVLAAATTLTVTAPAGAAPAATPAPTFLSAADLPPHPYSAWSAGAVTDGVPVELLLCLERVLPADGSRYRDFWTELDTTARQLTVVAKSATKAGALAARIDQEIRSCPERVGADPEVEAALEDHGPVAVEEGAHVYGLHTRTSWGANDIRLISVGRDDRTVTVVDWSQIGDFDDAPVAAFRDTTTAAVDKLY